MKVTIVHKDGVYRAKCTKDCPPELEVKLKDYDCSPE